MKLKQALWMIERELSKPSKTFAFMDPQPKAMELVAYAYVSGKLRECDSWPTLVDAIKSGMLVSHSGIVPKRIRNREVCYALAETVVAGMKPEQKTTFAEPLRMLFGWAATASEADLRKMLGTFEERLAELEAA